MTIKQILFSAVIFNSIIISGLTAEATQDNSHNRVLNKGWWNGINDQYFTSVLTGHTIYSGNDLSNMPVVTKNRKGQLKLAGNLGQYNEKTITDPVSLRKSKRLLRAINNNYGVVCNDRFLIVHSDQVSDCEKVLTQFHKELKSAEEGIEFLKNEQKELIAFFVAAEETDDEEKQ